MSIWNQKADSLTPDSNIWSQRVAWWVQEIGGSDKGQIVMTEG